MNIQLTNNKNWKRDLGWEMKMAREHHSWTIRELGEYAGVSQTTVTVNENGKRAYQLETLLQLAQAMNLDLIVELRPRG